MTFLISESIPCPSLSLSFTIAKLNLPIFKLEKLLLSGEESTEVPVDVLQEGLHLLGLVPPLALLTEVLGSQCADGDGVGKGMTFENWPLTMDKIDNYIISESKINLLTWNMLSAQRRDRTAYRQCTDRTCTWTRHWPRL